MFIRNIDDKRPKGHQNHEESFTALSNKYIWWTHLYFFSALVSNHTSCSLIPCLSSSLKSSKLKNRQSWQCLCKAVQAAVAPGHEHLHQMSILNYHWHYIQVQSTNFSPLALLLNWIQADADLASGCPRLPLCDTLSLSVYSAHPVARASSCQYNAFHSSAPETIINESKVGL